MTFDEWVNKRKNKSIDYDGYYGVQCCDLANDYFANVHGIPSSALFIFYNAINYFTVLINTKLFYKQNSKL